MFVESKGEDKGRVAAWLEDRARQRPGMFTAALMLLAAVVAVGLLFKTGYTLVLYQSF